MSRAYSDVTIDEVAAAASVTKGAVYHHFTSKEQLYLSMLQHDLAEKRDIHQRAVDLEGTCEERLRRLVENFLALPETKRNLIGLVRRDVNTFEAATREALIEAYQAALPDLVEKIIVDGIADGEIMACDARLMAWQFVALVEVILTSYAQEKLKSNKKKVNHVIGLFLRGCSRTTAKEQG